MELFKIHTKDYTEYLARMLHDRNGWAQAYAIEVEERAPKGIKGLFGLEKKKHKARIELLKEVRRQISEGTHKYALLSTVKTPIMHIGFEEYMEVLSYMDPEEIEIA